ncbi:MAG: DUF6353 family protein, partial [Paenisporosarcina sp.]
MAKHRLIQQSTKVMPKVTKATSRQLLILKKQSPNLLFVGGIFGIITSTVLACRATLRLNDTLDDIQNDVNNVKQLKHEQSATYLIEDWRRDTAYVYTKGS